MKHMTDEEILYGCYREILRMRLEAYSNKANPVEKDKKALSGIASRSSIDLMCLSDGEARPETNVKKHVIRAKGNFINYSNIKGRNPEIVSGSLDSQMDTLIRAVAKKEAEMIYCLRQQEMAGERIDLAIIFSDRKKLKKLGCETAKDIVSDFLGFSLVKAEAKSKKKKKHDGIYITETGKKYHKEGCPYCRGTYLSKSTKAMADHLGLEPCKCIGITGAKARLDCGYVTAFVDESIRLVKWGKDGFSGATGSYSYIICKGNLSSENEITDECIIAKGVDFALEQEKVQRITEAAIGKVLISLAYDYNYSGNVCIFTDNKGVADCWKKHEVPTRMEKEFSSVKVSFIPREKNKKADALGRTRMLLDIPIGEYEKYMNLFDRMTELQDIVKNAMLQLDEYKRKNEETKILECMEREEAYV